MYIMNLYSLVDRIAELEVKRRASELEYARHLTVAQHTADEMATMLRDFDYYSLIAIRGDVPQKVVANRASIAQSLVSRIEGGDIRNVSLDTLQRILQVYAEL